MEPLRVDAVGACSYHRGSRVDPASDPNTAATAATMELNRTTTGSDWKGDYHYDGETSSSVDDDTMEEDDAMHEETSHSGVSSSHPGGRGSIFGELASFMASMQPSEDELSNGSTVSTATTMGGRFPVTPSPPASPICTYFEYECLLDRLVRHDVHTTSVTCGGDQNYFPTGYGPSLGRALVGNAHVTTLQLPLDALWNGPPEPEPPTAPPRMPAVEAAPSLPPLDLRPLLTFVRTSVALVDLVLCTHFTRPVDAKWVDWIVSAATDNPHSVIAVRIGRGLAISMSTWCRLVTRPHLMTTPLGAVGQWVSHWMMPPFLSADVQGSQGLGTHHASLECLTMYPASVAPIVTAILVHLPSHPCLTDLVVHGKAHDSTRLRHLELAGYDWNGPTLHPLWTALTHYYSGTHNDDPIIKLSFTNCTFDADATASLIQFWQSPVSSSSTIALRALAITGRAASMGPHRTLLAGSTPGRVAARIVTANNTPTLGSRLRQLTLDVDEVHDLFAHAARHAARMRVPHVEVGDIHARDWSTLRTHVPHLVHLQELTISLHFQSMVVADLLSMLRRNGSLHAVHVPPHPARVLTTREARLAQAYLDRNRLVPQLIVRPSSLDDATNVTNEQGHTSPRFFPTLFESMAPALRMAPQTLLLGLLALGDMAGQSS